VVLKEEEAEAAQTNFYKTRNQRGESSGGGSTYGVRGHSERGGANMEPMGNRGAKRNGDEEERNFCGKEMRKKNIQNSSKILIRPSSII
jgi:hypothetical protein